MWSNLCSCRKSIGLLDGISPIPEIEGIQFLLANTSSPSKRLLQDLGLARCLNSVQVIRDHIIPAWKRGQTSDWVPSCKEQVAAFMLGRFSLLNHDLQSQLRTLPFVPVTQLNGEKTSKFALAADLIDPTIPELKRLCFEDEEIIPKDSFFQDFEVALKGCGLKTAVDEAVVEQRVRCYASSKYPLSEVQQRARRLLKSSCRWSSPLELSEGSVLRKLKWIPVLDLSGALSLKTSSECRGHTDRLVASSELPILGISISSDWEARLGWHATLPDHMLSQLNFGIRRKDRKIVDAVLEYVSGKDLAELLAQELRSIPCVLVSSGIFVTASQAVRPPRSSITGCERLQPYIANVDYKFWEDHELLLMRLGIGELQPTDLLQVQATLEAKPVLDESDVVVAIEILILASKFPRSSLTGLKAISDTRKFYLIHDINFDDLGPLKSKQRVNLTHPDIPLRTIRRLEICSLRERLIKGMLEIEDVDDEDEFDQRENVTTRIADTLDRYPVETTFREYLANADDAKGASKISWLLDERTHPYDKLLTPEMKTFQGPAFLVQNDGGESP
jgi:sacsin